MAALNNEILQATTGDLTVALKDYFDELFQAQCNTFEVYAKAIDDRFDGISASLIATLESLEKQFVTVTQATVLARDTVDREFKAITKATDLARESMEGRLIGIESTITHMRTDIGRTISRDEYSQAHTGLANEIQKVMSRLGQLMTIDQMDSITVRYNEKLEAMQKSHDDRWTSSTARFEDRIKGIEDMHNRDIKEVVRNAEINNTALEADIRSLRESRAELEGKASQKSVTVAYILGVAGVVIGLAGLVIAVLLH